MNQERFKEIKARCKNMMMQAKCFRKVISNIDPVANSPMTDTNIPIKVLADWGRNACDTIARQDLSACIAEIERLQALVKTAHREGLKCGNTWCGSRDFGDKNTLRLLWEDSEARKALEAK